MELTHIKYTGSVAYLNEGVVTAVRQSEPPLSGQSRTGYGAKIPTDYELQIGGRWHRVYVINYGNAGSTYVLVKGKAAYFDFDPREHPKQVGKVRKTLKPRWR